MKSYYGDITVIEKRRIRVDFDSKKKPTKTALLEMLNAGDFRDITDEESIEYQEVINFDLESTEAEEDDGDDD